MITVEKPIRYEVSWRDINRNDYIFLKIDAYDLQNLAHILTQNKIEKFNVQVIESA